MLAASQKVAIQSCICEGVSVILPVGIFPGQRTIAPGRMPPSKTSRLTPEKGPKLRKKLALYGSLR